MLRRIRTLVCKSGIFSAECKPSATAERHAAPQKRKQQRGLDFPGHALGGGGGGGVALEGGGVGTRPWWLALLTCDGAYWPLAFEPSAMTSRHPPAWGGIQNATSAHGVLP